MKRGICPITKQPLDCQNCKAVVDDQCPYFELDNAIEYTLKFLRKLVEKEKNENSGSRMGG